VLASSDVELIVNLTPPRVHAAVSLDAIAAGKHVWSEKPLAATVTDAATIVSAAADAGVVLGCAPDTFLGGGHQTARKLLDDGWIGEPVAAVACVSEHGYEHFHPEVEPFYSEGGGPIRDLGPYYLTALVSLLGPVARVAGMAKTTFPERTIGVGPRAGEHLKVRVPTHVTGVLEMESGATVTLLASWDVWATHLPYLEVYGTRGSLALGNPDEFGGEPRLRIAGAEELRQPPPPPGSLPWSTVPLTHDGEVGRGIGVADMAYAIRTGRPHRATGQLAFHTLDALAALERSEVVAIESNVDRPAPLPMGLPLGQLDS
jgi:predicted dehydrogenase